MLKDAWKGRTGRYVSTESIKRCWRKSNILPEIWNIDIHNDVGRASVPEREKALNKDDSDELCDLISKIKLRANESSLDTIIGAVFKDLFVTDRELPKTGTITMAEVWVEIEDNEKVMNAITDNELQEIDESAKNKNKITVDDCDDDEEDEIIMAEESHVKPRVKLHIRKLLKLLT